MTIFQEVAKLLPHENLVYLADTANFPYGNKSPEDILRFSEANAAFLLSQNIKLLVIACYTASSYAFEEIQKTLSIPVITVEKSGLEQLAVSTRTNSVAILGTTRTIESGSLQAQILAINPLLQIHAIACPLFAPFVEEGLQTHPTLRTIAAHYLAPLQTTSVDTVLLACTHYPLLSPLIQDLLGPQVQLISPANLCAVEVQNILEKNHLLNLSVKKGIHQVNARIQSSIKTVSLKN